MLLPSKHLATERSILSVGSRIIACLKTPATVSELWNRYANLQRQLRLTPIGFDWFLLALASMFAIGKIGYDEVTIWRENAP